MKKLVKIVKSKNPDKKYDAIFETDEGSKTVSFGASANSDYTIHKDRKRMENYRARHQHDNLKDPMSPGALSWYVLWSSTSLKGGIANYRKEFNL